MNRTDRLMAIILLLRSRNKLTASQLAEIFEVSVRTIYRDIDALCQADVPIAVEMGPEGGYSLLESYSLPPVMFTLDEAVALFLGGNFVSHFKGTPFQDAIKTALIKIEDVLPPELQDFIHISAQSILLDIPDRGYSPVTPEVFESINQAIFKHKCVQMTYYSYWQDSETERIVAPYGLIYDYNNRVWYVIGFCYLRNEQRMFRVGHIRDIALTERDFEVPQEFELKQFVARGWGASLAASWKQKQPRIRIKIPQKTAVDLQEDWFFRYAEREDTPDGKCVLTYHQSLRRALYTLRRFGPECEVLEPPELRKMVIEQAQKVLEIYDEG